MILKFSYKNILKRCYLKHLLKCYSQKHNIRKITQKFYDLSAKYFDVNLSSVVKNIKKIV